MFAIAWPPRLGKVFTDLNAMARSGTIASGDPVLTAAALLLFVGACGKSAQLPLYIWLPDAWRAPPRSPR